jgi:hypothetical protein
MMKKISAPGRDGVAKIMVQRIRGYSDVLAKVINLEMLTG